MIKAIETHYNGYRFRSRLEARWAVFFDALGVDYEYEKEGFVLSDNTPYLPDLWLPHMKMWVEIKPTLDNDEQQRCARFFDSHGMPVLLLCGSPAKETMILYCNDIADSSAGGGHWENIEWCMSGGVVTLNMNFSRDRQWVDGEWGEIPHIQNYRNGYTRHAIEYAYRQARSARFEHGEKPLS